MNYTKPEVAVLGEATVVIESTISKLQPVVTDFRGVKALTPAYDLDE
jgi:hypothetical protein